jgi:hypothetical protein
MLNELPQPLRELDEPKAGELSPPGPVEVSGAPPLKESAPEAEGNLIAEKSDEKPLPRRGWVYEMYPHILFWVAVIAGGLVSSYLVDHGLFFGRVSPVPMRVNPVLFAIAFFLFVFLIWLSGFLFNRKALHNFQKSAIIVFGLVIAAGAALGSMHPSPGSLVSRDELSPALITPSRTVFALPVFFRNGDSRLVPDEAARLKLEFATFADCASPTILVRGFASSALYRRGDSNGRNTVLANNRAITVRDFLITKVNVAARVDTPWDNYTDMAGERRIRDVDLAGLRLVQSEGLNRRAEIFWESLGCVPIDKSPKAEATKSP